MKPEIEKLISFIQALYPSAEIEAEEFSAGTVWLIIRLKGRDIELEIKGNETIGVTLHDSQTLPFTPHNNYFHSFPEAQRHVISLIEKTILKK